MHKRHISGHGNPEGDQNKYTTNVDNTLDRNSYFGFQSTVSGITNEFRVASKEARKAVISNIGSEQSGEGWRILATGFNELRPSLLQETLTLHAEASAKYLKL